MVGAWVGVEEGDDVWSPATNVGELDCKWTVGELVGETVGPEDGDPDGATLGACVGEDVTLSWYTAQFSEAQ